MQTFQFLLVVVIVELFKSYALDRIQHHGRGGRAGRGGIQGFSQGLDSTAFGGADLVDTPVPRGGGLHGFRPRQVSIASSSHSRDAGDEASTCVFRSQKKCGVWPAGECRAEEDVNSSTPAAFGQATFEGLYQDDDGYIWSKVRRNGAVYWWNTHTQHTRWRPPWER